MDLGRTGSHAKSAVPALIRALGDPDARVRAAVAPALLDVAGADSVSDVVEAVARDTDVGSRTRVINAMNLRGNEARAQAASPVLLDLAFSNDVKVRLVAIAALGSMGDPSTLPVLLKLLGDEDELIRFGAAGAIGGYGVGGKAAVPSLIKMLEETHPGAELGSPHPAAISLASIGAEAVRPTALVLKDSRAREEARYWAQYALSLMSEDDREKAVIIIADVLSDDNPTVRGYGFRILRQLGERAKQATPALEKIEKLGETPDRIEAAMVLYGIDGNRDPVPVLIDGLKCDDQIVRCSAARYLAKMQSKARSAVPALVEAAHTSRPGAALECLRAIHCVGGDAKSAVTGLRAIVADETVDKMVRESATRLVSALENK
jgi:HEAT repeat protein